VSGALWPSQPHAPAVAGVGVDENDTAPLQRQLDTVQGIHPQPRHAAGALGSYDGTHADPGLVRQPLRGPVQKTTSGTDLRAGEHSRHAAPQQTRQPSKAPNAPCPAHYRTVEFGNVPFEPVVVRACQANRGRA